MQSVRIFTGPDGRSRFEDFRFHLPNQGHYSRQSVPFLVTGATVREMPVGGYLDLHHPPARQLVVVLDGRVEFRCGDGAARVLGPGDVMLAEDLEGEGHSSRELDGPRRSLFLPLPPGFDLVAGPAAPVKGRRPRR